MVSTRARSRSSLHSLGLLLSTCSSYTSAATSSGGVVDSTAAVLNIGWRSTRRTAAFTCVRLKGLVARPSKSTCFVRCYVDRLQPPAQ
jgi:hypothetical protein